MSTAAALGLTGALASLALSAAGAAYGTSLAGEVCVIYSRCNDKLGSFRCLVPTIMSGVLGIYGLIIAVIIISRLGAGDFSLSGGWAALSAGLAVGFSCLFSGFAIGKIGRAGIKAYYGVRHEPCWPAGSTQNIMSSSAAPAESAAAAATAPLLGDTASSQASAENRWAFVVMTLNLIFAESLGLYGLIVALLLLTYSA